MAAAASSGLQNPAVTAERAQRGPERAVSAWRGGGAVVVHFDRECLRGAFLWR